MLSAATFTVTVALPLFSARIAAGEPKKLEHQVLKWITVEEIGDYAFCPADADILKDLRAGKYRSQ